MRNLKETNAIRLASAVLVCCLLNFAVQVHAQSQVRALSLQECFETALENNLTVQIERVNPELSLYDLRVSEGAYDPSFFFSYRQQNRQEPGRFDPTIGNIPGSSTETDSFSTGISRQPPTGTSIPFKRLFLRLKSITWGFHSISFLVTPLFLNCVNHF